MLLDLVGLKCPQPILRIAIVTEGLEPGTHLEVRADCPTFPEDIAKWCEKNEKNLISCDEQSGGIFEAKFEV